MPAHKSACPDISELEPFVLGELSHDALQWKAIDEHISTCAACRSIVTDITANLRLASSLKSDWPNAVPSQITMPETIGEYRLVREIGRGGMGVVYEAQQHNPHRRVALKLLNVHQGREHFQRLFEREVQALGRLKHPSIAIIHAAAKASDDRPYLVMELAAGEKLTEWARRSNATLAQKLKLFTQLCDAIAYAHQRGVIHRDLKPSNIVIDHQGNLKVLDFGLAKLSESDDAESVYATAVTEIGRIQGTLPYMSPEQARGETHEVDVRSDVYSLGVMLFELLTGTLPYDADWSRLTGAVRAICEEPPKRPSTLNHAVRGDLETIVLKTLEKEPSQRYAGASALSDDINRFLLNEPITARPPTLRYQVRKMVARHPVGAIASIAMVSCLLAAGIWLTLLNRHANAMRTEADAARSSEAAQRMVAEDSAAAAKVEAERAQRAADRADAISTFLTSMLAAPDPTGKHGRDVTVARVLTVAAQDLDSDAMQAQAEVEAAIRLTLAGSFRMLEMFDEAESQYLRTLQLYEQLGVAEQRAMADTLGGLGVLYRSQGRIADAENVMRRALAIRRELFGDHSLDVATSLNNLSVLLQDQGKMEEGETLAKEVLTIRVALLPESDMLLPMSMNNLGLVQERMGKFEHAAETYLRAIDLHRTHGIDHPYFATAINNLGIVRSKQKNHAEALTLLRDSLAMRQRVYGDSHSEVANSLSNIASALVADDRAAEAEPLTQQALEMAQQILPAEHWYIFVLKNLRGECLMKLQQFEAAEQLELEALEFLRKSLGEQHARTRRTLRSLAELYTGWNKPETAAKYQAMLTAGPNITPQ